MVIFVAIFGGIVRSFLDLQAIVHDPLEEVLRKLIVDILILLAVVEIYKTTYTYFAEGRVRVTYIVDTVIVVMLSEVISSWFKNDGIEKIASLLAILFSLIIIRVVAIRFHPKNS